MRYGTGIHSFRGTNRSRFSEAALHAASRPGHKEVPSHHCCASRGPVNGLLENTRRRRRQAVHLLRRCTPHNDVNSLQADQ
jgi:hypothetical protein